LQVRIDKIYQKFLQRGYEISIRGMIYLILMRVTAKGNVICWPFA